MTSRWQRWSPPTPCQCLTADTRV